jgi:hypothetical protein
MKCKTEGWNTVRWCDLSPLIRPANVVSGWQIENAPFPDGINPTNHEVTPLAKVAGFRIN